MKNISLKIPAEIDKRQSTVIAAMRFPLIVLVLIAHSAGEDVSSFHLPLDGYNLFHFFSEMISRHLCSIGVCWFYVFSGYFFFRYIKEGGGNLDWFLKKWEKRVYSLLLPFVIWNLLPVLLSVLIAKIYGVLRISSSIDPMTLVNKGPFYWFFTGPANFPLYFMRDLMIMSLTAPLIYFLEKKAPIFSLILLSVFYFSTWTPTIPHYRSIFYFGLGAWLGIHRINMLQICRKVKIPAIFLTFILLPLATGLTGHASHELVRRLFFPFGMITMMNLCDGWIDNEKVKTRLVSLSATVFFIFAAHEVFILGWVKGAFLRIFGNSLLSLWISYIFVPFVVLGICLSGYYILNRFCHNALQFACGGRINQKNKNA